MKYIIIFSLFISGLFAHGGSEVHAHFFSSLHVDGFAMFIVALVASLSIYKFVFKGNR